MPESMRSISHSNHRRRENGSFDAAIAVDTRVSEFDRQNQC